VQFSTSESKFKRYKDGWEKLTDGLKDAKPGDDDSDQ
jgi:hypothetical protein